MVPAGRTPLDPCGEGEGLTLVGNEVGAGRGLEFWNTAVGLGDALVAAKVVPRGTEFGEAVVTTPDGALLLLRVICCPPWTFCWRFVWKVPVFWLNDNWL